MMGEKANDSLLSSFPADFIFLRKSSAKVATIFQPVFWECVQRVRRRRRWTKKCQEGRKCSLVVGRVEEIVIAPLKDKYSAI